MRNLEAAQQGSSSSESHKAIAYPSWGGLADLVHGHSNLEALVPCHVCPSVLFRTWQEGVT